MTNDQSVNIKFTRFFTCTGPTQHAAEPMDVAETTGASDAVVPASCLL